MVIALIFIARLSYLQLFTDRYALNAINTSIKIDYTIPQRGVVFDRNGKALVSNQPSYEISYSEHLMKKQFDTLGFCKLMQMSKAEFIEKLKEIDSLKKAKKYSKLTAMTFLSNLDRTDIARIQEVIFKYPAFSIIPRPQRKYLVETSGNLLGYTGKVSSYDLKKDSIYYRPNDFIGKTGVEKAYEKALRGEKGIKHIQRNIRMKDVGPYKDGTLDKEEVSGSDITLTIDYEIQEMAEKMLKNKRGAIVAINPENGEIITMASGPGINPQSFAGEFKKRNIYRMTKDSFNMPMMDRSVQSTYAPGSTFKLLTALAGMQMGVLDEKTIFPCGRGFYYKGVRIAGHGGAVPLAPSIKISSNCYFSYAYLAILKKYPNNPSKGIEEWKKIMESFGLNNYLNNDLAVGAKGSIPGAELYRNRNGKNWKPMNAVYNGMGQGDILLTPIQMANFTAAIANEGWYYTPHIVKSVDGKPNPDPRFKKKHFTLVQNKEFYKVVKRGMAGVVRGGGTARRVYTNQFSQLAKTGTSQVPYAKDNSLFVLIAPAEKPKIVVAAVVENAGYGGSWAGPMSSLVAEKYLMGKIKRTAMYNRMLKASFMGEYRRKEIKRLKRRGWYKEPKKDSLKMLKYQDSLSIAKSEEKKLFYQNKIDSLYKRLKK